MSPGEAVDLTPNLRIKSLLLIFCWQANFLSHRINQVHFQLPLFQPREDLMTFVYAWGGKVQHYVKKNWGAGNLALLTAMLPLKQEKGNDAFWIKPMFSPSSPLYTSHFTVTLLSSMRARLFSCEPPYLPLPVIVLWTLQTLINPSWLIIEPTCSPIHNVKGWVHRSWASKQRWLGIKDCTDSAWHPGVKKKVGLLLGWGQFLSEKSSIR